MAITAPVQDITAMPAMTETFCTEARIDVMRLRPSPISTQPKQAIRTEAGMASTMTRAKDTVMALAAGLNPPTRTST